MLEEDREALLGLRPPRARHRLTRLTGPGVGWPAWPVGTADARVRGSGRSGAAPAHCADARDPRPARRVLTVLLLLGLLAVPTSRPADAAPACGRLDRPETGLQGEVPLADQLSGRAEHGLQLRARAGRPHGAAGSLGQHGLGRALRVRRDDRDRHQRHRRVRPTEAAGHHDAARPRLGPHDRDARGEADRIAVPCSSRGATGSRRACPSAAPMDIYDVSDCARPTVPHDVHLPGQHPQPDDLARRQPGVRHVAAAGRRHPRSGAPGVPRQPRGGHPPTERAPGGGSPGELPGARGADEPGGNILYLGGQTPLFDWFTIVDITGWPARTPRC